MRCFPGFPAGARWKRSRQTHQAKATEHHLNSRVSSLQAHRLVQTPKPENMQAERDKNFQNNRGSLKLLESVIPSRLSHLMWSLSPPSLLKGDAQAVHTAGMHFFF